MYSDPIIQKIFTAIKAKNGEIKKYYEAFPLRIGDSELPAIVISKVRTEVASLIRAVPLHETSKVFH